MKIVYFLLLILFNNMLLCQTKEYTDPGNINIVFNRSINDVEENLHKEDKLWNSYDIIFSNLKTYHTDTLLEAFPFIGDLKVETLKDNLGNDSIRNAGTIKILKTDLDQDSISEYLIICPTGGMGISVNTLLIDLKFNKMPILEFADCDYPNLSKVKTEVYILRTYEFGEGGAQCEYLYINKYFNGNIYYLDNFKVNGIPYELTSLNHKYFEFINGQKDNYFNKILDKDFDEYFYKNTIGAYCIQNKIIDISFDVKRFLLQYLKKDDEEIILDMIKWHLNFIKDNIN